MLDIDQIKQILSNMNFELDENTDEVLNILIDNEIISENDIAEKLDVKINGARKALYKLKEIGFVEYTKERDEEKKWWYIYFWKINRARLLEIYQRFKEKRVKEIVEINKNEKQYSFESASGEKYTYDSALSKGFIDEEGAPLTEINNFELLNNLEEEMHDLNSEISNVKLMREEYKVATEEIEEE
ncbi:MAG: hypothetical protein VW380_00325 [Candidatus Woesearchaeota archaeon]